MKYSIETLKVSNKRSEALIIAGLHGNETSAIFAAMDLRDRIRKDPSAFVAVGKVTFLIGVNEAGIRQHVRESGPQYDGSDLNRLFYQEVDYRALLTGLIEKADVVVDVHNSPMIDNCVLLNFDLNATAWRNHFRKNGVQTLTWIKQTPTVKNYVNDLKGKRGFTIELNGLGFDGDRKENVEFLHKAMAAALSAPMEKGAPDRKTVMVEVSSPFEGMLSWDKTTLGKKFNKGDAIASLCTFEGDFICYLDAPSDGILVTGPEYCFVNYGETVFGLDPA